MRSLTRAWLLAVGFLLLGMGLLWWASAQQTAWRAISASEFVMPGGRIGLWLLTMAVAGACFGLAKTAARRSSGPDRVQILAGLALVPLVVMVLFLSFILGWWEPLLPSSVTRFLFSEMTLVASALLLGFLVSGLVDSRVLAVSD